jgi:hypothetical protein
MTSHVFACRPRGEDASKSDLVASQLAEAGFYFTGLNDSVQCSQCNLVLHGWTETSPDPWIRHAFENPDCAFLETSKGSQWILDTLSREQ